ncbi:hypothetical protein FRB99_006587 [Tulasnella sp. 403]|nr:hypothetical protein FRB99_006587 [Tulasnella sp. 403]
MSSESVRLANEALPSDIAPSEFQTVREINGVQYGFRISRSSDLSEADKATIWDIFKQNMREAYTNSSFGWHPREKRKELFHQLSRFILAYRQDESVAATPCTLAGYTMFRFDEEETMEDGVNEDVAYCYELQISPQFQRAGLGAILIHELEAVAKKWRMQKVMLTVFRTNYKAICFYEKYGYSMDAISPSNVLATRTLSEKDDAVQDNVPEDGEYEDIDEVDYEIYSKIV